MHFQENIPLAPYTTLGIGGPARYFADAVDEADLWELTLIAKEDLKLPCFLLGGGSNLLVPDEGYPGLVIHTKMPHAIVASDSSNSEIFFDVSAGTDWDAFVFETCRQGISGAECLAGIPGMVGGSPVQNIGAYGQEVSQIIDSVRVYDRQTLRFKTMSLHECGFSYRTSVFNRTQPLRYIVSSVRFCFSRSTTPNLTYADLAPLRDQSPTPLDVYHHVRQIRDRKGMLIDPANPHADSRSAGSFFKNPIVPPTALTHIAAALSIPATDIPNWPMPSGELKLPAAWLIERAGFPKGFTLGPVGISTRHTLALVNRTGTATCTDLLALRDLIMSTVAARFHVSLEQEPVFLR